MQFDSIEDNLHEMSHEMSKVISLEKNKTYLNTSSAEFFT